MNDNPVTLISQSRKTTKLAVVTDRCLNAEIEKFGLTHDTTHMVSSKLPSKKLLKKTEELKPIKT
jgi:hypothetical protein